MLPACKHGAGLETPFCPTRNGALLIDGRPSLRQCRHVVELAAKAVSRWRCAVSAARGARRARSPLVGGEGFRQGAADPRKDVQESCTRPKARGRGQLCNNISLVITISASPRLPAGQRLGRAVRRCSTRSTSGSSWAVNNYLPLPGPVPTSPANRDYQAGFTADNMLKDLKLAQQAAQTSGASTPMGAEAAQLFNMFVNAGGGAKDFSGIIKMLEGK